MLSRFFGKNKQPSIYFGCNQCGECCRDMDVPLSHVDILKIMRNLKLAPFDFMDLVLSTKDDIYGILIAEEYVNLFLKNKPTDNSCMFLKNNACSVYDSRPNTCKTWPFSRDEKNNLLIIDDYAQKVTFNYCDKVKFKDFKTTKDHIQEGINEMSDFSVLIKKWNILVELMPEKQTLEDFIDYLLK